MRKCYHCKQPGGKGKRELRPYGPSGADVCAECVLGPSAPPERLQEAEKRFLGAFMTPGPHIIDSRDQVGPLPLETANAVPHTS